MKNKLGMPSPAMVIACIALFVAFTGSAVAAGLAKNSVGSKQIKKNAVISSKIKSNAVSGSKVKNDSLTGSDINESTLGTVPSATNATNATNATTAASVAGTKIAKLDYNGANDSAPVAFFSGGGLTLTGSCPGGTPTIEATTSQDGSAIRYGVTTLSGVTATDEGNVSAYEENDSFDIGDTFSFTAAGGNFQASTVQDSTQGTFTYAGSAGIVTGTFLLEDDGSFAGRPGSCHFIGSASIG